MSRAALVVFQKELKEGLRDRRSILAALAATLVDLVRIPPDDNMPCAAVSGAVLRALRSVV